MPRLQNVQPHHISHGIVQDQRQKIEIDDTVEALGKIVKQRRQIALLRDGLATSSNASS